MRGPKGEKYSAAVRMTENMVIRGTPPDHEGISLLANAIIIRAVEDYREGHLSYLEMHRFLHSDWFLLLSRGSVSPESILKEVSTNGKKRN